jgi:magnesium-protoporphyrin O-methyltransferase
MTTLTYQRRRGQLEEYFDRTASEAWARLTSDAPVSRIRATVRAGRDRMRATLLSWLPANLSGQRLLDAGCGTGALAVEAARRGAHVTAIDLSATLVELARVRHAGAAAPGEIEFLVGDFLDERLGEFDYVVAMDSLIHYRARDIVEAIARLAVRTSGGVLFTYAPRTPALSVLHAVGKLFPRRDRAPAIEPVSTRALQDLVNHEADLERWCMGRDELITSGFYKSRAMELIPA